MKTCLIVDDSRVIRLVARKILEEYGFTVSEAENGAQGLEMCRRHLPDGVLVDWQMPIMDGIEFLTALRQLPGGRDTAVILCTTENTVDHIKQAIAAGADEYIMKPFDSEIIHSKLTQVGLL
ncbi:MAG: response regulator [Alphaproteobacteria bacterium]